MWRREKRRETDIHTDRQTDNTAWTDRHAGVWRRESQDEGGAGEKKERDETLKRRYEKK